MTMESKRMKLQSNNGKNKLQFTEQNESKLDHLYVLQKKYVLPINNF